MADFRQPRIPSGGRDDLRVDLSRCLRMRFSESSCRRCADSCPHQAVNLDGILSINPRHCTGCLICSAVCPVGALEHAGDFSASLARLARVPETLLGCIRTRECSHATISCLGGLSEEHLVALSHSLSGTMTLNLSACADCPNRAMIPRLRRRLDAIAEAGLSEGGCRIVLAESALDVRYRAESVDRRGFFTSFRNSLFRSAAIILSPANEQVELRAEYAGKRLPARRELLNRTRKRLSPELQLRLGRHFDSRVSIDDGCTGCQGCVAICPTGALRAGLSDQTPTFDRLLCTSCGLCGEFCLDGALRISAEKSGAGAD